MRAVLDPNVIISAALSSSGAPARLVREWLDGAFELVVSPLLLEELERALAYPKLRKRIPIDEAAALVALLRREAELSEDPAAPPPAHSPDPDDDYLLALAAESQSHLVSGDGHLLGLANQFPIYSPAAFLTVIETGP